MSWLSRIGNVFRRARVTREIDEELESHIAEAIEHGSGPHGNVPKAVGGAGRRSCTCGAQTYPLPHDGCGTGELRTVTLERVAVVVKVVEAHAGHYAQAAAKDLPRPSMTAYGHY